MQIFLPFMLRPGVFFVILLVLVSCQNEEASKEVIETSLNEEELNQSLEEKRYGEVRSFIKQNIKNDEKEPLVDYAIRSLNQTGESENLEFLKELYVNWIETRDYKILYKFITSLETERNGQAVTQFLHDVKDYEYEREEVLAEKKRSLPEMNKQHDELVNNYPYPIPLNDPTLIPFSGEVLQRISESEYRVIDNYSAEQYVLKTFETAYTSSGRFNLQVIAGERKSYPLDNGFSREFLVLYEIPEEQVEMIQEIKSLRENIPETENSIEELEQKFRDSVPYLKGLLDAIFETHDDSAPVEDLDELGTEMEEAAEEWRSNIINLVERDNKFYLNEVTLQNSENELTEILGEPDLTEEDVLGESDIMYIYRNLSVGLFNGRVTQINAEVTEAVFEENILKNYSGEKYVNDEGTIFLYNEQSGHLLMAKSGGGSTYVYFSYVDSLFKEELEAGNIRPQEDIGGSD